MAITTHWREAAAKWPLEPVTQLTYSLQPKPFVKKSLRHKDTHQIVVHIK